jgi:hypothetical protein
MNDPQLDKLLKSARPPERSADQWAALNKRIAARLHWQPRDTEDRSATKQSLLRAWGIGLAAACAAGVLTFLFWPGRDHSAVTTNSAMAETEVSYSEILEMFPNQVRAIVFADGDSRIELSDKPDQSDAQPIFLKVCGPHGCQTIITFSGQRIRVNGDEWEVLASGKDGVIVAGKAAVWTSNEPAARLSQFRIEAKQIKSS